jgi:CheY-like chemotaxis protein
MVDIPKRAIVIDDEPMIGSIVEEVLRLCGYSVASYSSPAAGAIFKEPEKCPAMTGDCASFDTNPNCAELIISDVRMPFYSGLEYVTTLRQVGCKVRHIALMSGNMSPDEFLEAEALGCKVFEKPFTISEMTEWILSLED